MGKKKSCQNVKVPRPFNAAERKLYGWVEEAIFTQPSVVLGDSLPELRRNMRLTEETATEGDFVLEAAGPSDWLPLRADEDGPHFLWVYQELFTRLGVHLPFMDFQREVMMRCRVAVSQLHLNGWGLLRIFEKVCLHFGFRPTSRLFLYIYDILIPPTGYSFISFRARQVCPLPAAVRFGWMMKGGLFRVYWNREVKDFVIHELDPLEMAVFEFLVSLSADDLLLVEMKKTKLDRMMEMMVDPSRMAPQSVHPTGVLAATAWEHAVNPLDLAFLKKFNYRKALDAGLTFASVWKPLQGMLADQLLRESWHLQCQALACQQLGLEAALKAKTKTEEELLAVKDQLFILKLSQKEVEHKSALERVAQLDEDIKVLKAQLRKSREEADYWCTEWKSLGTEVQEMCQEMLEIVLDQVSHLCPGVDFSVITLKTHWDPKGKRIYVPEELLGDGTEVVETLPEVVPEQQQEQGNMADDVSGEYPT
ncbi:hypothetical protein PIB30_057069 [Stylosanthes scabra]|uniref:Transposase (Putative), gypsy type n=1 Tax=Stylosanthes scabra TaxID=79078 RepID=A0ABU6RJU1_9FABA|nr:hypothetical protein [Stylosanthes scabra]